MSRTPKRFKRCRDCKFAEWKLSEKGNIRISQSGDCMAPLPKMPPMPDSMLMQPIIKYAIWPKDGTNCPAFEQITNQ